MLLTRRQTDKQAKDQNITFRPPVVTVTVEDRKRHRPTTKYNKKTANITRKCTNQLHIIRCIAQNVPDN